MKKSAIFALIFLLLIATLAIGQSRMRPMSIGSAAPDFSLRDLNGKFVSPSDFKGKSHVMLVFFRGWLEDHF